MSLPRKPFEALRRFTRPEAPTERCGLCGTAIPAEHEHLCAPGERKLHCACTACAILFSSEQAARFRRVTPKLEAFPLCVTDGDWIALGVPVGLAFFYRSTAAGGAVAVYPSPAGPLESAVEEGAWESLVASNPTLRDFEPDVEAILVNRVRGASDSFRCSIDHCYHLIGLVRAHWSGFSGGPELWDAVDAFFGRLRAMAKQPSLTGETT
jgi:hypothetical protein